jgi:hypothetical protein
MDGAKSSYGSKINLTKNQSDAAKSKVSNFGGLNPL